MKIALNAQLLTRPIEGGIPVYALTICQHLIKAGASRHEFCLVSDKPLSEEMFPSASVNKHVFTPRCGFSRINSVVFARYGFSRAFKKMGCDVAFFPWIFPFTASPVVMTVHDLVPLCSITKAVDQFHHRFFSRINFQMFAKVYAKRAALLIADSEDTKRTIQECCGVSAEKIRVVPLGVNFSHFYPRPVVDIEKIKLKYQIKDPYFINVASMWQPRKNLESLLQAFAVVMKTHPHAHLVITGKKGPSYAAMLEIMRKSHLEKNVHLLEFVPYQELPYLLSGALGLVFPSFHEGFGLPVLEAMSCGCPVICSDRGALPEVGGHAVHYVNPFEVDSIVSGMNLLLDNEKTGMLLRAQGFAHCKKFSWENTASLTLKTFEDVYG